MKKRAIVISTSLLVVVIVVLGIIYAKKQMIIFKPEYAKGELLIKFKPALKSDAIKSSLAKLNAVPISSFRRIGVQHIKLPKGLNVKEAIKMLEDDPNVEYAEPNYMLYLDFIPNDPRFPEQWALNNTGGTGGTPDADIDAAEAWDIERGSDSVVIGITDTGIDYNHEDLSSNIWVNSGETPGDGIDNDVNGYKDDVHGFDFALDNSDPMDCHDHGTHVAGIIGAIGDNDIGVAGINFHTRMMALKIFVPLNCGCIQLGATGTVADAVEGILYAVNNKAMIINASWHHENAASLRDAIAYADSLGVLFVAAAGNDSKDNDITPFFPANYGAPPYNLKNVIAVASTDHNNDLSSFSNWGKTTVHLGAPGEDILSTIRGNKYGLMSGTSMASPQVAGVAGLVWSHYPDMNYLQVKDCILDNVDVIPSLTGKTITDGRLNAEKAVICPGAIPDSSAAPKLSLTQQENLSSGNALYISQLRLKYKSDVLFKYGYYCMLLVPVFFILGWKKLIRRSKKHKRS